MGGTRTRKHGRNDPAQRRRPLRRAGRAGLVLALLMSGQLVLGPGSAFAAPVSLDVTTTADIGATAGDCGSSSTAVPSPLSLREATCIANNYGTTAVTINVPSGTYTLTSGELALGKVSGSNITLTGASAASTIIDGNHASRVLDLDKNVVGGVTTTISNVTIKNGRDDTFGGAGIIGGSATSLTLDSLTISNSTFVGNEANFAVPTRSDRPGGGVSFQGGKLQLSNDRFTSNASHSSGGSAVWYQAMGAATGQTLTVDRSTFDSNSIANSGASGTSGGALAVSAGAGGGTYTVTNSTFTGNTATSSGTGEAAAGAAIFEGTGNLTVTGSTFTGNSVSGSGATGGPIIWTAGTAALHYNRFVGNTGTGGVMTNSGSGSVDAAENWWGCNAGANTSGCETTSGTNITATPRLVLAASASPAQVTGPNATSTITASLLTDSAGGAVSGSNLTGAFDGVPVTFADPPGDATVTLTNGSHTVNLSSGTASIDYHSNTTVGPDNDLVTLDNATVTAALEVDQPPAITSANAAQFLIGTAGSFTVTTTGYPAPVITKSGTLPTGVTFTDNGNGTATIAGTPANGTGGNHPLTLTANNGVSPNATQTFTLSVGQAPAITSATTATFVAGTAGSFTVTTTGLPTVSTITESGLLPTGVTFTDNGNGTATIAGTPTGSGGTYPVTLTAKNGISPDATQNLTVQVNQAPQVTLNPSTQTVTPGTSVSFAAAASGVPAPTVQWQRSTDGGGSFTNIAGATSTTYTFTAVAGDDGNEYRAVFSNGVGSPAITTAATLNVGIAPAFTSADHVSFAVGQAGSFSITTSGVPSATLSRTGAQFPAWLTLTDNGDGTGTLTGTPPAGSAGTYQFTLKAANGFSPSASQNFTLSVDDSPVITSADHTTLTVGQAGSFAVTTTAGFPTTTTITKTGSLPSGVTFHDNGDGTATLAGTPAAGTGGSYPLTITATATGSLAAPATQSFVLTVLAPPVITSADHATFDEGSAGSFTVTTTAGNPATSTLTKTGTLPAGVSFTDNGDGTAAIAGTPNVGTRGVYVITVTASNGVAPDATQTFTLTVSAAPNITSVDHATFVVGTAGSFTVTTTGAPTSSISETGSLPSGLTFTDNDDGTATLAGTPTTSGSFTFTITAGNGVLPNATQTFTATVNAPPAITSADHTTFAVGSAGSFTVTTTAGVPSSTTITESGGLPSGVTFTDNGDGTATLAGTPVAGTGNSYPLTITASNGILPNSTESFTLTVTELPAITSADHTAFTVGDAGSFTVTTTAGYPVATTLTETGSVPSGVTFTDNGDGTATLAGTPAAGTDGTFPLTLTATNAAGHVDQAFTLTVEAPPALTSADHTTFAVGSAGSFTVTTVAGMPPSTTITETGDLPSGITFTDNGDGTATLAGTPVAGTGNSYPLTITASNGILPNSPQSFTLTVTELPAITSADHTAFPVGVVGSFTVTATAGYPVATTLTETGSLPSGVTFTDNGDGTATLAGTPAAGTAGSYPLSLTATNSAGHVDQAFTLTVGRRGQTITVTSTPPSPAAVGSTYELAATSDSGLPVAYSIDAATTNAACTLSGSTVTFAAAGNCVVDFDQAGDGTFAPAAQVQQPITVTKVGTAVAVTTAPASTVYGQDSTATATVTADRGTPAGTVQFSVDGTDLGAPVTVSGGTATSPVLTAAGGAPLAPGSHQVSAAFTPSDGVTYATAANSATHVVDKAATTTTLTVHAHDLTAVVAPVSPGAGTPTGTVDFTVGGAPVGSAALVAGVATLTYTVPAGRANAVAAAYSGDTDFTASSVSTTRNDPKITARVTSAHARSHYGWYRSAVTVTFTCTPDGAPLTGACPAPVVLRHEGAGQSVSRTISATDGGMATVVVSGIDIDLTQPRVAIAGVRAGATYGGVPPRARCVASDRLSGVASCRLTKSVHGTHVTYRATATDRAGNVARLSVTVTVLGYYLVGAPYVHGAFTVRAGHSYTLVVNGSSRQPVYYDAAIYPQRPTKRDNAFHHAGHDRWTLGIYMQRGLHAHRYWNIGVRIGRTMHLIKIRVV